MRPRSRPALNKYAERRPLTPIEVEKWHDFGHLPLYFQSKRDVLVARVFNSMKSDGQSLIKSSSQTEKMQAEAHWYENLPPEIRINTPRYLGRIQDNGFSGYALEYLYHPTLSDLRVFGRLPMTSWLQILANCVAFVEKCRDIRPAPGAEEATPDFAQAFYENMFRRKTCSRLDAFCATRGIAADTTMRLNGTQLPPLNQIVAEILDTIPPTQPEDICFWHGDLFFGNMFFDFRAQRVICVDPRGQLDDGRNCIYGDYRYDLAKLAHSILGDYDKTIMSRTRLDRLGPADWTFEIEQSPGAVEIAEVFVSLVRERFGIGLTTLRALAATLFFSMLPLHYDNVDRQDRILASGLVLYDKLKRSA